MRTIWKHTLPFPPHDQFTIVMRRGEKPIRVETQHGKPCLWTFVPDSEAPSVTRKFGIVGTGHPIEADQGYYVGSFHLLDGDFVGHVFIDEVPE